MLTQTVRLDGGLSQRSGGSDAQAWPGSGHILKFEPIALK